MPLDDVTWPVRPAEPDTTLTRRRRLIEGLRDHPQPWDFRYRQSCALGLAVRLGIAAAADPEAVGAAIGLGPAAARRLFMDSWNWPYRKRVWRFLVRAAYPAEVTPLMVADALERIGNRSCWSSF